MLFNAKMCRCPFIKSNLTCLRSNMSLCFLQDVPLFSSPVQMTTSFTTLNMGNNNHKSRCGADGSIQQNSFGESRKIQREVFSLEEQLLQYQDMDGIALSDVFLCQYFSQVRGCRTLLYYYYYITVLPHFSPPNKFG